MSRKTISFSTAAAILVAYLWSQLQPNDGLFLLMSPSPAVNFGLLAISGLLVRLSFIQSFKTVQGYVLTVCGAACGIVLGAVGLFASSFYMNFFSALGPLDYLLLTQIGVLLALCALTAQHQPVKLAIKQINLARLSQPKLSVGLPQLALHQLRNRLIS